MRWMACVFPLLLVGCAGLVARKHTYGGQSAAEVNGAQVALRVKPEGTDGGSFMLSAMVVAGGVGANRHLRAQLNAACQRQGVRVHYPELHLCTDNGAMIAMAAAMRLQSGEGGMAQAQSRYSFDVKPRWSLAELA